MNPTNLSTPPAINDQVKVTITSLSHGGSGVGRFENFVIFCPFTCPGDTVLVKITSFKKNYAQGELLEILEPSPQRVSPPCAIFGSCGGCQWQHVSYEEQLRQKQAIVEHALSRIAKEEKVLIHPIIPSPQPFNYRNRAQLRAEGKTVGFYKRGTHSLVEFDECLILEEPLNQEVKKLKGEQAAAGETSVKKIEIYLDEKGQVRRSENKSHGEESGFSQINTRQNQNIQDYIKEIVSKPAKNSHCLDLYCGSGNFSFPLNELGWNVHGVDSSKSAISVAKKNSKENTTFSANDVVAEAKKLSYQNRHFDLVILDPPRIGAQEGLWPALGKLQPKELIYISCDPATFARDWARLKTKLNLKLESIQPFDMFPQTFHVELVALAKK